MSILTNIEYWAVNFCNLYFWIFEKRISIQNEFVACLVNWEVVCSSNHKTVGENSLNLLSQGAFLKNQNIVKYACCELHISSKSRWYGSFLKLWSLIATNYQHHTMLLSVKQNGFHYASHISKQKCQKC